MNTAIRRTSSGLLAVAAGIALFAGGATAAEAAPAPAGATVHAALPFGSYTCKSGSVWRGIGSNDPVCVSPNSRQTAANETAAGANNKVPGTDTCKSGFVWREAQPSDHVCVLWSAGGRDRVATENQNSAMNLADPSQLPYGSVSTRDQHDQTTCYMYGSGRATPNSAQWFWGVNVPGYGTIRAGVARADGSGNVPPTLLRNVYRNGNGPIGISTVVTDTATGIVTRAGITNSYGNC